jgi:hypothetical protein
MSKSENPLSAALLTGEIRFDYVKSNHFRVVHVDGVHGGARPNANSIHMALFNERNAIPKSETYSVTEGRLGPPVKADRREAVIREVEIDAVMDLNTAKALRQWLDQAIGAVEQLSRLDRSTTNHDA